MDEIKFYNENGYLLLNNFFDIKNLIEIKQEAIYFLEKQFIKHDIVSGSLDDKMVQLFNCDFEAFTNCGKHIQQGSIELHKLGINDKLINKLKKLGLSYPSIATRPVLFFNSPNLAKEEFYYKTPPHQDWNSIRGSKDCAIVWIPLIDITPSYGPLRIVPKSHIFESLMSKQVGGFGCVDKYQDQDFIDIEMSLGDILIFSSFLVHQSGKITNNGIRWSCSFRYNNLDDEDFINRKYEFSYIYKPKFGV